VNRHPEVSGGQQDPAPLVTVAMPVFNAGNYLRLAVLSIVRQSFADWELLIVDDGSTDDALRSIRDIDDARIRILRDGENRGLATRLNQCIGMARGRYLARMDQDDVSYPERFQRQVSLLEQNPGLDLVAVRAITIDENDRATGMFPGALTHDAICARPWQGFHFPHPTWMGKTAWFRRHRYAVPGPYFCEDQELLLRSHRASRLATVDETLFAYRIRSRVDAKKLARIRRTMLTIQLRHFAGANQWHFVLLALAAFVARMGLDLSKRSRAGMSRSGRASVDDAAVSEWDRILAGLAAGSEAP
jgi:glycosyltransferase involved in cell wall biosynthesis